MMGVLKRMFGASAVTSSPLLDSIVTRWDGPLSRGSYTYAKVGQLADDPLVVSASVDDVLFFAGEHCSLHRAGYADGAFVSGIDAAHRVINVIAKSDWLQQRHQQQKKQQQQVRDKIDPSNTLPSIMQLRSAL